MSSAILERLREQLATLIAEAAAEAEQHQQAQQAAAQALEAAHGAPALAAAYEQGRHDERRRLLFLLADQRATLARGGINAISLETLSRRLEGKS